MFNLEQHFQLDPSVIFLNHGSFGATPKPVMNMYRRWQEEMERQPVEFLGRRITALLAKSRTRLGAYLGTEPSNLVYTQNVTISLNIVARSLKLGANDEVLSTDHEYGAVDRTWRFLAREGGFKYINQPISIPIVSDEKMIEDLFAGVTPNTRVISVSHVTSPTAIILPIEQIVRQARARGILTVIDGAHAPGQIPVNLDALGADFYGGNLHKWLCAPKGAGFLYASPSARHLLKPLVVSWGYESETSNGSEFLDHNEWWGTRDHAAFLSVPAAIEFQHDHSWDKIRDACHALAVDAQRRICELTGLPPLQPPTGDWFRQMVAVPLPPQVDAPKFKDQLYEEFRIEVPILEWNGNKLIRISVQGYNTEQEVDALVRALSHMLSRGNNP